MERSSFHVTHVALDAGQAQGDTPALPECFGNGVAFDAVTHNGAGAMGFDIIEVGSLQACPGSGPAHHLDLPMAGGSGDHAPGRQTNAVVHGTGGVDGGGGNHRVDQVAVPFSGRQRFQGEDERPFRAHVAVGVSIKGMAFAVCADHAQCIEAAAQAVGSQVGGGSHQGQFAVSGLQTVDGPMECR